MNPIVFTAAMVLVLGTPVLIAKRRSVYCTWDERTTTRNKTWATVGIVAVVLGLLVGYGIGPDSLRDMVVVAGALYWLCSYRLALALYRGWILQREPVIKAVAAAAAQQLAIAAEAQEPPPTAVTRITAAPSAPTTFAPVRVAPTMVKTTPKELASALLPTRLKIVENAAEAETDAIIRRVRLLYEAGHHETAIDELQREIRRFPRSVELHQWLAYALGNAGKIDEAIIECNFARGIDPEAKYPIELMDELVQRLPRVK